MDGVTLAFMLALLGVIGILTACELIIRFPHHLLDQPVPPAVRHPHRPTPTDSLPQKSPPGASQVPRCRRCGASTWPDRSGEIYWRRCESCRWIEMQEPHRLIKEERRQRLQSIRSHYDPDVGCFMFNRRGWIEYLTAEETAHRLAVTEEDVEEAIRLDYLRRKGN